MNTGLSAAEVELRKRQGLVNRTRKSFTKTKGRILIDNIFTYFNILTVGIFLLIIFTGSFKNTLFIGVVFSNAFMGILQELKAKQVVDSLSILTATKATVLREGKKEKIPVDEIVQDDVLLLKTGDQISVDAAVLSAEGMEVDESLLTGESEPVIKNCSDKLMSGSFVVAGSAVARAEKVGEKSYAAQLTKEAKKHKRAYSEILDTINKIIRYMSFVILPIGVALFVSQFFRGGIGWKEAVIGTSGAVIGMIPSGLVLISTVTLALGVLRCAQHKALINEPPAVEVLARVNMLCIDKTGTLTDGSLEVEGIVPLEESEEKAVARLRSLVSAFSDKNATASAIIEKYGEAGDQRVLSKVPFSSTRKWSGVTFADGAYILGAPEMILRREERPEYNQYAKKGYRVLLLARCGGLSEQGITGAVTPSAFVLLTDRIREDAREVLQHFRQQEVQVKIISGDNPVTVSNVAARLGLEHAERYVDMSTMAEDGPEIRLAAKNYTIFGRVSPRQKKNIVLALKQQGNTVAMTGDGVNDVLAMREADCGIAMAQGSDAARGIAKIVMMDSDFAPLVKVVAEGRRVVNNLERVSSLYLVKTIFSALLSVFFIFTGLQYPLEPLHLTLIGSVAVGMPSFFLALEKNTQRIREGFQSRILKNAIPGGLVIACSVMLLTILQHFGIITEAAMTTHAVWQTGIISLVVLYCISRPLNWFRGTLIVSMLVLFVGGAIVFSGLLGLSLPAPREIAGFVFFAVVTGILTVVTTNSTEYK